MSKVINDEKVTSYHKNYKLSDSTKLTNSHTVYNLLKEVYGDDVISHHEEFHVLFLNIRNRLLDIRKIAQGGITGLSVDIRLIFQQALKVNAVSIIISHNHPSGEPYPSTSDMVLTKQIVDAGKLLDIKVLDHIIICDSIYYSFANSRKL